MMYSFDFNFLCVLYGWLQLFLIGFINFLYNVWEKLFMHVSRVILTILFKPTKFCSSIYKVNVTRQLEGIEADQQEENIL